MQLQRIAEDVREVYGGFSHGGVYGTGAAAIAKPGIRRPLCEALGARPKHIFLDLENNEVYFRQILYPMQT